jgi:hypothetical protein
MMLNDQAIFQVFGGRVGGGENEAKYTSSYLELLLCFKQNQYLYSSTYTNILGREE